MNKRLIILPCLGARSLAAVSAAGSHGFNPYPFTSRSRSLVYMGHFTSHNLTVTCFPSPNQIISFV